MFGVFGGAFPDGEIGTFFIIGKLSVAVYVKFGYYQFQNLHNITQINLNSTLPTMS